MAGLGGEAEPGLWRRFYAPDGGETPAPDALALAAYADGRLSEEAAAPIERWLAAHPELLDEALADISAARGQTPATVSATTEAIIAKACALVGGDGASGNVVPFRRAVSSWRNALAWSSVAASLVAVSLVGFAMGSDAYQNLSRTQASDAASADAFDAAATIDSVFSDYSGT